jgi:hypothetical protein
MSFSNLIVNSGGSQLILCLSLHNLNLEHSLQSSRMSWATHRLTLQILLCVNWKEYEVSLTICSKLQLANKEGEARCGGSRRARLTVA